MPIPPVSDSAAGTSTPDAPAPQSRPDLREAAPIPQSPPEKRVSAPVPEGPPDVRVSAPQTPADLRVSPPVPRSRPDLRISAEQLPAGAIMPSEQPRVAVRVAGRGLGTGEALGLVALYLAVVLVAGLLLGTGAQPDWSIGPFQAMLIGQVAAGALVLMLGLRWSGLTFDEACPTAFRRAGALPGLVLAALGLGLLLCEVNRWSPGPDLFSDQVRPLFGPKGSAIAGALSVGVVAPVMEELLFRGVLLRGLLRRHSPLLAAAITAVVFALYHLDPVQAAAAFPLGLLLAWVAIASGSVLPAILLHVLINAVGLVDSSLVGLLGYGPLELATMMHLPETLLMGAAAAAFVGCILLWHGLATPRSTRAKRSPPRAVSPPPEIMRVSITILAAFALVAVAQREARRLPAATPPQDEGCYRAGIPSAVAAALFPGDTTAMPRLRLTRLPYLVGLQAHPKYLALPFDSATADAARRTGRVMFWTPAADGGVIVGHLPTGRMIVFLLTRQGENLAGEITYTRDPRAAGTVLGDAILLNATCTREPPAVPAPAPAAEEEPGLEGEPAAQPAAPAAAQPAATPSTSPATAGSTSPGV